MASWAKHRRHDVPGELVCGNNPHTEPNGTLTWHTAVADRWFGKKYRPLGMPPAEPGKGFHIVYPWR